MKRPKLAAIINLTPDSFSGDGKTAQDALEQAKQYTEEGAEILDVGAESTRPGATPVSPEEEWKRLEPFLKAFHSTSWPRKPILSIDTRHPETAQKALQLGVDIINDQGGLKDPKMLELLAKHNCDIVVMHALTVPVDKSVVWEKHRDPIAEILTWKNQTIDRTKQHGIGVDRLIFDPGLGFGKRPEQSLQLILRADELIASGNCWLYGHSRKSFLTLFTQKPAEERDDLSLALSTILAKNGTHYLRVHEISKHAELLDMLCI